jgi:putative hydrolase of the HAD superfamily
MRNIHHNIVTNVSDILLDIDGVLLDQSFDNLFWGELVPLELSTVQNISIENAKNEIYETAEKVKGTMPWYELEFWESKYNLDLIKVATNNCSKIAFLPRSEETLKKLADLDKRIILMTNCDRRLLNVKASIVPFMKYVDGCVSCVEIGAVKESQDFWGPAFELFNIDTEKSLFADDNINVVNSAIQAGIFNSFQVLEPTSDGSVINKPNSNFTIKNIGELI